MSIDRSLRLKNALVRHRNVLTRAERIAKLQDEERWEDDSSVLGLPKVAHRKSHAGKKAATEKEAAEAAIGVEGAAAPAAATPGAVAGKPAATAAKAAPGAKSAAKAAAPAAQKSAKEAKKK